MTIHNAIWKSVKRRIGLQIQTQTIQKLIPGQTEIKQTNNLIKLSHRIRHWFMNSTVRSMEINTQKFGTEQVRYREQTTSLVSLLSQRTSKINFIHAIGRLYVWVQKGASVFIWWQIMHVRPTQTTQSISNKLPLHAFYFVNTNIIERVPRATCVFQFWTNQRRVGDYRVNGSLNSNERLLINPSIAKAFATMTSTCSEKSFSRPWWLQDRLWSSPDRARSHPACMRTPRDDVI
jgi:hypothetical protein